MHSGSSQARAAVGKGAWGLTLQGWQVELKQPASHSWFARVWVVFGYCTTYVQSSAVLFGAAVIS